MKKPVKVSNGWEIRRSTIPGNYNLTHVRTGERSGKIVGWESVIRFINTHTDGKVANRKIGSKTYPE